MEKPAPYNQKAATQYCTKLVCKAYNCPKIHIFGPKLPFWGQNCHFGAKIAGFGSNILIFSRGTISFGTHISENHSGTSFTMFFLDGPEGPILLLSQNPIFFGEGAKLNWEPIRHFFRVEKIDQQGHNAMGRWGQQCAILT